MEGSTRRQTGEHTLRMWEVGQKHREQETRSLIDKIGQTRMEQEADKALLPTVWEFRPSYGRVG